MRFVTLGPSGSCHENALASYLHHHRLEGAEVRLRTDLFAALEELRRREADYLVVCSAYPRIHELTERYHREILVSDTFIYPTKDLCLLERAEVDAPRSLGLVKATEGYLDEIPYEEIVYEASKPIIGARLLAGEYDAGLTHLEYHTENPGRFRLTKRIGRVITTWVVFGRDTVFRGEVLGVATVGFYARG